jgi:TIR domain
MGETKPKVFLSYARADDEAFVERLHGDLIQAGVEVWWDRAVMESRGRTFLQEIRDAIEGVDRVIAVIGPKAIASDYVRYEWDHALLHGVR